MSKNGHNGKILWIDLTTQTTVEQVIPDSDYQNFLGGYGLASKIIFENQAAKLPALHPDNIMAITSGLLTNGRAVFNGRWMIAGKSPLTGTWGDANCGGDFAPAIKASGYDGFYIKGKASEPVYVLISNGSVTFRSAKELWGIKDAVETEAFLKQVHGEECKVVELALEARTSP
ncbi:MAG: hypothetical protein JW783_15070 [Bacteroidales bacterium]|nr:hypothetical protein [Bacteroidales bacterium]MBN2747993.1 hypothetical protein [Bacteroidales bacterium]